MASLQHDLDVYHAQLASGHIQRAYRAILSFMASLKSYLEKSYPGFSIGTVYPGYMDMTYLACTSPALKDRHLKVAIVYLHAQDRFEAWLGGVNRSVQAHHIELLQEKDLGTYRRSHVSPGVDSIIEAVLVEHPDFVDQEHLKQQLGKLILRFTDDVERLLA